MHPEPGSAAATRWMPKAMPAAVPVSVGTRGMRAVEALENILHAVSAPSRRRVALAQSQDAVEALAGARRLPLASHAAEDTHGLHGVAQRRVVGAALQALA